MCVCVHERGVRNGDRERERKMKETERERRTQRKRESEIVCDEKDRESARQILACQGIVSSLNMEANRHGRLVVESRILRQIKIQNGQRKALLVLTAFSL